MPKPVIAFLAFTSGSYEGAIIRDTRLANILHRRGYKVVVYWMMETNSELLDKGITQKTLCRGMRYHFQKPGRLGDLLGSFSNGIFPLARRRRFMQQHPDYVTRIMTHLCRAICDGDPALSDRLEQFMIDDGVTHLLPTFAMICPFAQVIKEKGKHPFEYLVTFQGEEIFANFADAIGRLDDYHKKLRSTVAGSKWSSIAVSHDYANRLHEEMGIDLSRMTTIYPGIEIPVESPVDHARNFKLLQSLLPRLNPEIPMVTYLGRQDAEKGIDLLLYAVKILAERGVKMQLVCVGGSSFGQKYADACKEISAHLRLQVFRKRRVSDDVRTALYQSSRCVVYPSIHREPFGLVAAEAMSYGTPVLVPDRGGIAEVVSQDKTRGGMTFKAWDSGDLADQLEKLLLDDVLIQELRSNARAVAGRFSTDHLADAVLKHVGLMDQ